MHKNIAVILVLFTIDKIRRRWYIISTKTKKRRKAMNTLELLQLQNEHRNTLFEKGEDFICESIDKGGKKEDNNIVS